MKRWTLILSTVAVCIMASSQAQASWSAIPLEERLSCASRGQCDFNQAVARRLRRGLPPKTLGKALSKRARLVGKKACW